MFVNVDGHVVELNSPEDVRLFVACLLPTQEEVDRAKADCLREREATGLPLDADGRIITEAA